MKKISILGSTGSIGLNALKVIYDNSNTFEVVALSANRNINIIKKQIEFFKPKIASVMREEDAILLRNELDPSIETQILFGQDGYKAVATIKCADIVISAMVGSAGLIPTLQAIGAGKDIALANKEVLVMAGNLIIEEAKRKGVRILPIDSEHSAIFQCITGRKDEYIKRIILTASGGPFLNMSKEELENVKPIQALNHPKWRMGHKISVDSASMMNKGFEVIEAKWLFSIDIDRIDVIIHPQSIIHSMVEFIDGAVMAQLGAPDMKIPIAYALAYPNLLRYNGTHLDILKIGRFDFMPPDFDKFPNLKLAYEAGKIGGTMPAVLNAVNEITVDAFLEERIRFVDMPKIIENVLSFHTCKEIYEIQDVLDADEWARDTAVRLIERMA